MSHGRTRRHSRQCSRTGLFQKFSSVPICFHTWNILIDDLKFGKQHQRPEQVLDSIGIRTVAQFIPGYGKLCFSGFSSERLLVNFPYYRFGIPIFFFPVLRPSAQHTLNLSPFVSSSACNRFAWDSLLVETVSRLDDRGRSGTDCFPQLTTLPASY